MPWTDFVSVDEIPLDEPILCEIDSHNKFQIGYFRKTGNNRILGVVGSYFYFDLKIVRWVSLKDFIDNLK